METLMDSSEQENWYCLKIRPRQEKAAKVALLSDVGVPVFCPMLRFERARRTGRVRVTEAMFPGYLFAFFCHKERYRQVATTNGVSHIVSFGGRPAVVEERIIEELRTLVEANDVIELPSRIEPGTEVNVVDGPMRGIRTIVTRVVPGRARVAILLELLGTSREVEIEESALLPDQRHPLSTATA